jgi:predicted DNA-binding transcriptional regulator YafY
LSAAINVAASSLAQVDLHETHRGLAGAAMRHEPAERILQLACAMQGSRMGLSLSDIEKQFGVGRRTAQRLRDAVMRVYPQTEQLTDNEQRPRWRIPTGGAVMPGALAAEDIVELEATAKLLRQRNLRKRATALETVARSCARRCPHRLAPGWRPISRPCSRPRALQCGPVPAPSSARR